MEDEVVLPISVAAARHGLELGKKVYLDKLNFSDKFFLGGANELQADIYGFIAETVVCEYFKKPFPVFIKQSNDLFDLEINGLKVDVKKVGYSQKTGMPKITLNKKQFFRKRKGIDAFLFCTFEGGFQQIKAGIKGFQVFIPLPLFGKLKLLGWIKTEDITKVSKTYIWRNKDGTPRRGDESFLIEEKDLMPLKELIVHE